MSQSKFDRLMARSLRWLVKGLLRWDLKKAHRKAAQMATWMEVRLGSHARRVWLTRSHFYLFNFHPETAGQPR